MLIPLAPAVDLSKLNWDVIRVCLSFFHSNGFYLFSDEFAVLLDLLSTYHSGVVDIMGHKYFRYLYSYAAEVYRHLPASALYVDVTQNAVEAVAEDISYTIYFPQDASDSYIPYPALPLLT